MLRTIAGRSLLAWVVEAAQACRGLDRVVVAVDSDEVAALCEREGWPYHMTDPALVSGTDRMHAVALLEPAAIYINIQGDEPLLEPAHVAALLAPFVRPEVAVTTLSTRATAEEFLSPNAVKVVTGADGRALYFSRASIPFDRDGAGRVPAQKHLGLYAYRAEALRQFHALAPSPLEQCERLEQLRLLEHGIPLYVSEVEGQTIGVDTEDDLRAVEAILLARIRPDRRQIER